MQANQPALTASRRATLRRMKQIVVGLAMCLVMLAFAAVTVAALPVSDASKLQTGDILASIGVSVALVFVFALVALLVTAVAWKGLKMSHKIVAVVITGILWGTVLVAAFAAPMAPAGGSGGSNLTPVWTVLVPSTVQGTPRDAASEIFDTQGGTGGGGETPTATLCAFATNCFVDRQNHIFRMGITRNTALATSAAGFQAPDIFSADLSVQLMNPRDVNGDGVQDSVAFFGRVRSISQTTTQDGNQTVSRNIFMRDNTFGWYMGWSRRVDTQATDGQWMPTASPGTDDLQLGTSYGWQNLGSTTGADEDYIAFAFVARNYGFFGYTQPPSGYSYNIVIDIGTPDAFQTYTMQVYLASG